MFLRSQALRSRVGKSMPGTHENPPRTRIRTTPERPKSPRLGSLGPPRVTSRPNMHPGGTQSQPEGAPGRPRAPKRQPRSGQKVPLGGQVAAKSSQDVPKRWPAGPFLPHFWAPRSSATRPESHAKARSVFRPISGGFPKLRNAKNLQKPKEKQGFCKVGLCDPESKNHRFWSPFWTPKRVKNR